MSDAAVAHLLSSGTEKLRLSERKIQYLMESLEVQRKFLTDSCAAEVSAGEKKLKSCLSSQEKSKALHTKAINRLNKDLARKCRVPWYKSPYFHLALVTVAVAAGGTAVVLLK